MPTSNCKYHQVKKEILQNKEKRASRSPQGPRYVLNEWCEHEDSPQKQFEKGKLICKGDISKCPIGVTKK